MKEAENLLFKIADFNNLCHAFKDCSRGKKQKSGYQNFLFNYGEKLKGVERELIETGVFKWGIYREFEVADPKKRTIMAAPFRDRVLHTAIHRVIAPVINKSFGARTYACRPSMGNRNAVIRLWKQLNIMGSKRYCIKLDVKQYFSNIDHDVLEKQIFRVLGDEAIRPLLKSLISSHSKYNRLKCGIPIGNLTSQLFANLYLSSLDRLACELLEIDFYDDSSLEKMNFYIRYMDDIVIVAQTKEQAFNCANKLVEFAEKSLKLSIPNYKKVSLSNDPVPFLGFVLDTDGYRVLARNKRKLLKKVKRMDKTGASLSDKAIVFQSYNAWRNLEEIAFSE